MHSNSKDLYYSMQLYVLLQRYTFQTSTQHFTCLKPQKTQRGLWSIKPQSLLQKEHSNSRSSDSSRRPVYVSIRLHPTNAYIWAFSMKAILAIHSFCFPNNTLSVCLWAGAAPLTDRTDFIRRKKG